MPEIRLRLRRAVLALVSVIIGFILAFGSLASVVAEGPGFETVFADFDIPMLLIEPDTGRIVEANPAAVDFYGYPERSLMRMTIQQINTFTAEQVAEERQLAEEQGRNYFIFRHQRANGDVRTVEVHSRPYDFDGRRLLFSVINDITPGRHESQDLWHYQSRLEEMVDEQVAELEQTRLQQIWLLAVVLVAQALAIGVLVLNIRRRRQLEAERKQVTDALRYNEGELRRYASTLKHQQKQLERIAHFDPLTGLPNRTLLADRLQQAMARCVRNGSSVALVFIDLDGFKAINDTHSHAVGDQLLVQVARQMKRVMRAEDTLARLGGDEFVAVLLDLDAQQDSIEAINRLLEAAAEPITLDDLDLSVSASIGVAFYPQSEPLDPDQLLRQADQAMYQAKQAGKNRYCLFDAEQERAVRDQLDSLERIRVALENEELVLHYQPKINMRTGEVLGAEALVRWQHPERGLLPPGQFLPVIENTAVAIELGNWVMRTALAQVVSWKSQGLRIPVSINIDAIHLQHPDFMKWLTEALDEHPGTEPGDLELEILETAALDDVVQVSGIIKDCDKLGVVFSLDDFGTGYSSLTYLKRLPARVLKIDRSFVRDMLEDPDDLAILQGVIRLADAFGRRVIAEGVESQAHCRALLELGCDWGQGYAIAKPMSARALQGWVIGRPE
ncbi:PAS domain S-box-containing protein/diguanylate cyclase (GGDEF) domain-containing protein [Marinobacter persicus]|uniref:PAS domain S-box-containing protein/diguanylate cyclase (GGDEF) domain-containing protein n=1 Tax=Marinobacter persicus TaxID=930118 RepID=A0A1I3TQ84_9GAMM|nr:EAL domain-containing protein [Marinobacter persicus]GHD46203.1 hypothetical protein GCM10008110_12890 [Marinobacter persicus]SFJ71806.1 PAS domain S-box-containing protein/diguanylate cyclase (GGDEF) domain-containing protein [Marinobacter persicus]